MELYSLVPAITVLALAVITKKALEPLIVGCVAGYILLTFLKPELGSFPENFIHGLKQIIAQNLNSELIWVILVCLLYGSFVQLVISSGGVDTIGIYSCQFVKTKKQSLIMTYWLGFIFFLDDYLNALAVGNTMRGIADQFQISREKLAYVISLVCVPITVIIPLSTWTIFYGTQLINANVIDTNNPILAFMYTIPYNFSAWISLLFGLLVVYEFVPNFGKIKIAEKQAEDSKSKTIVMDDPKRIENKKGKIYHFALPLFVLIFFTIFQLKDWHTLTIYNFHDNIDALRGVMVAVAFTYVLNWVTGVMSFNQVSNNFVKGFETIVFVLAILTMTYLLKDIQSKLGFNTFVEDALKSILSKKFLPMIIFMFVGFISFSTGSNWGVYAILVPVVSALAISVGANIWLTQGALVSATVWGAAACFFSDNRVLTAQSTQTNMMSHAVSQFMPQLIIYALSSILYLIFGLL